MQLILDAEATNGIQSKMSRMNEESLDENLAKNLLDNFSNDLPHNGSDRVKNISLISDDKENELLENHTTNSKSLTTNESLLKPDAVNIIGNEDDATKEETFGVYEKETIDHHSSSDAEKSEKVVVDDDIKSDQNEKKLDGPVNNKDETIMQSNQQCIAENDIQKLDTSFDNNCISMENKTNSSQLENIFSEDLNEDKQISNLDNEVEHEIDEEAILEDVTQNDKMLNIETEEQNKLDEEAILEDIAENDKMYYLENEAESNIDEDAILEDIAENHKVCNLENETKVETVLKKVAEIDNINYLEIEVEKKIDEDAILDGVIENESTSNSEVQLENKIDETTVLEEVVRNDNTSNAENIINEGLVSREVLEKDNLSNLESDFRIENKLDETNIFENSEERNNEHGDIKSETIEQNLSSLNSNDLNSNCEHEKKIADKEESLTKDVNNIVDLPTDQNRQNIKLYHAEMPEKTECPEKNQAEGESTEIKIVSTDEQTAEKQDDKEKEKHASKDEKQNKETKKSHLSKLSNTLDILSDDEDELPDIAKVIDNVNNYNQSISLVDDDDVMLIEEDTGEKKENNSQINENMVEVPIETNLGNQCPEVMVINDAVLKPETVPEGMSLINELELMENNNKSDVEENPLLPLNVLKNYKKNLTDMTREELEEFCISKIVESVVNRSNIGDIKAQLKITARAVEEYKKKLMMISKQTRDLQVILKSVQEEQKKPSAYPVTPLKLTRSVGMQVFMTDKPIPKKRQQNLIPRNNSSLDKSHRNNTTNVKSPKNNQQIPVPRLVPAATPSTKTTSTLQTIINNAVAVKSPQTNNSLVNGLRNSPPAQKPEKRTRMQSYSTVDLTDDEPPPKIAPKSSPTAPVRLVPSQNLLAPQRQPFPPNINSPRKVYIPISSPQAQNIRPGQAYLLKSVPPSNPGPRPRPPTSNLPKMPTNSIRMNRPPNYRHPAPLPDAMKQYQPPNWKALPPAPDLKLSKVEQGIVISWKIDGYQEASFEEITSYQLYAYQETASPPSTTLWKKIGDVKALPLPMACTLTQFMAGFKYYFAVRAVDVKSRLGPFSLPGSILLLNKM